MKSILKTGTFSRREFLVSSGILCLAAKKLLAADGESKVIIVSGINEISGSSALADMGSTLNRALKMLFEGGKKPWGEMFPSGSFASIKLDCKSPLCAPGDLVTTAILENLFQNGLQPWETVVWDKRMTDVNAVSPHLVTRRGEIKATATELQNQAQDSAAGYRRQLSYMPDWLEKNDKDPSYFSNHLKEKNIGVINLASPKHHPVAGIDGALMNLAIGGINNAGRFFSSVETLARAVAELWKDKTLRSHKLTIMDASTIVFHGGPVGLPLFSAEESKLIISTDPVAVDTVAFEMIERNRAKVMLPSMKERGEAFLSAAEKAGLGSTSPKIIQLAARD